MKNRKSFFWIFFIFLTVILYYYKNIGNKSFKKHTKYTVATVISDFHYKKTNSSAGYDYIFKLNNKIYERGSSNGNFIKNRKYLLAYDSTNLRFLNLFNIDITDSLYKYPKNGWTLKEIPFKVDTVYIKNKINEL